ncbi:hypothetical protein SO802_022211 [Lithocarpus litseifolius]|uniref:Senescence-associated carboxylesterase 101-like n=1 Tax=Lithocarpus litseifolius TaxID=425828 RepID=A0AAW2CKE5_9ROSI
MEIDNSKPLIITGSSLGGSVASLFTLWLLETINFSITKRPLCSTFGSPLIGDSGLQNAILKYPTWSSCFLHVVSDQDPVPRVLNTNVYKPFGTFLLFSESECGCFEDSQTILELLMATYSECPGNQNPNQILELYRKIVEYLNHKETEKPSSGQNDLKKQIVASSLTEDSLFWAHAEEARISVARISHKGGSVMEKESLNCKLIEFENYVLDLMKNYAVLPEIFLTGTSFMKWWEEYRKIKGTSYSLNLANLMNNAENYDKYATGCLVIH